MVLSAGHPSDTDLTRLLFRRFKPTLIAGPTEAELALALDTLHELVARSENGRYLLTQRLPDLPRFKHFRAIRVWSSEEAADQIDMYMLYTFDDTKYWLLTQGDGDVLGYLGRGKLNIGFVRTRSSEGLAKIFNEMGLDLGDVLEQIVMRLIVAQAAVVRDYERRLEVLRETMRELAAIDTMVSLIRRQPSENKER